MKIKPAGKIAIFLALGVLIFFAVKRYLPQKAVTDTTEATTETRPSSRPENDASTPATTKTASPEVRDFHYTPEKPVNGILRGVVEVGASGFNSFVINMDKERRWEIVSKDFGESLAYEGLMTTDDIRAGLKKYLAGMFAKGVSSNNMHFVISSGAQKEPKTVTISNELKKMGYVVNNVTAQQEGKFALRATVPSSFTDNSFMVDIGSGNTKVSYNDNGNLKAMELPGAKYYEQSKADDAVYNEVKQQISNIPEGKRTVCFIIGGVPFSLAKQTRKGDERYTVLNAADSYKAADKKMGSGINIYKAIADGTKCDTFVFDWDANFTIGFLLALPGI